MWALWLLGGRGGEGLWAGLVWSCQEPHPHLGGLG